MKKSFLFSLGALLLLAASCCRSTCQNELVTETYTHKYGVPLSKGDWNRQGQEGEVRKVLKNGVTVTQNYEAGKLHGKTTYSFPHSSTLQKIELYEDGMLLAEIEHYPSGIPMQEQRYQDGQLVQVTSWYEDGSPSSLETYQEGLLATGEYRNSLNVIESRVQEGQGVRIIRDNDGNLATKDIIQNGQMIERTSYLSNGEPSSITPYENELIHGQRMTFLPGGLPNTVEQWIHGKQDGTTITYQNGEKFAEIPYHKGKKHGIERRFHDGVEVVEEISWNNDVRHGPSVIIAEGHSKTDWYHQGEIVSRSLYERLNERPSERIR